jgi:putative transcriptional regulator
MVTYRYSNKQLPKRGEKVKNQLAKLREQKGITQEELAAAAGVTRAHISRLENGHVQASIKVLYNIARKLEVKMEDIFLD